MTTFTKELKESFNNENWMTVPSAITQVQEWIKEKNHHSAQAWIDELKKFFHDTKEIKELEASLRQSQAWNIDKKSLDSTDTIISSSDLSDVSKSEKFLAAIWYFWVLCVLPLALKQDSEFCQWHWKQALLLAIFFFFFHSFGFIINIIFWGGIALIAIFQLTISIIWFIQANKWKLWDIPLIGDTARNLPM